MNYKKLEYSRNFNLGNYETERITLTVDLDETENLYEQFKTLKATVLSLHEEGKLLEESKKVAEAEPSTTPIGVADKKPTLNEINSLKSTEQVSDKGPYGLVTKSENLDNPIFSMLQSYLKKHSGYAILCGYKIWSFDNPDKIGYRKQ